MEGAQVGAYRVVRKLGAGGMGTVWLAEHATLRRRAAIKLLHPEHSRSLEVVTRFFNEARAVATVSDPGIVRLFGLGHHRDGRAYVAMEMLDGEPLDRRLARRGALALPEALRIVRQVASTLGAAHARGIVHRNLKPANVFLVRDRTAAGGERARVLDFGIPKLLGERPSARELPEAARGALLYMSPEQCGGTSRVDRRSDVYALGCLLFTLVVGHPPFGSEGGDDVILRHLRDPAPAPSRLRPEIPPEIDRIVLRCLAKEPASRFDHGGELAAALGGALAAALQRALDPSVVRGSSERPIVRTSARSVDAGHALSARRWRHRIWRAALVGLGVLAVAGAIALLR
jgi:eukaryotic-like serine/threonine-protein kinase